MKTSDINFDLLNFKNLPYFDYESNNDYYECDIEIKGEDDYGLILIFSIDADLTMINGDYYTPDYEVGHIEAHLDTIQVYKDGDIYEFDSSFFGRGTDLFNQIQSRLEDEYNFNL